MPKVVTVTMLDDGSVDLDCHGNPICVAEQILVAALTMLSRTLLVGSLKQALGSGVIVANKLQPDSGQRRL